MYDYDSQPKKSAQEQPTTSKELNKLIYELESVVGVTLSNQERLAGVLDRIASFENVKIAEPEDPKPRLYPNGYLNDLVSKIEWLGRINRKTDYLLTEIEKAV